MSKYLIKTIKLSDDIKSGDHLHEEDWLYVDPDDIESVSILGKTFFANQSGFSKAKIKDAEKVISKTEKRIKKIIKDLKDIRYMSEEDLIWDLENVVLELRKLRKDYMIEVENETD